MTRVNGSTDLNCVQAIAFRILILACVAFLPAVAQSGPSGATKPDFSRVRKLIQEQTASGTIPAISVAVARKGEVLWEEGFGWADREKRIASTEHTMYYTASVTKTFTETALMILYERKKLDLDRPVNDYLGGTKLRSYAWNPAEATVRRVANHTAGLATFNGPESLSVEQMIGRYGVLFWPPGEQFDYSNLGPIVLEEVIARVSGQPYADFMRSEVFRPLQITRASVGFEPGLEKHIARSYAVDPKVGLVPSPKGGIYCSAHDLLRFGMFHLKTRTRGQKAILSDRSIDAMQNETVEAGRDRYGLSWWVEENRFGYRSVLAQGGTWAAQAWLRLIPSEGIAVVLLANTGHPVSSIVDDMLSALLPVYAEKRAVPVATPQASQAKQLPPESLIGSWKGLVKTFRGDIPLTFSIPESGAVHVQLGSQPASVLDNIRCNETRLSGIISGNLGIEEDTGAQPDKLQFYLRLRDGGLKGAAVTRPWPNLPYWVELKK